MYKYYTDREFIWILKDIINFVSKKDSRVVIVTKTVTIDINDQALISNAIVINADGIGNFKFKNDDVVVIISHTSIFSHKHNMKKVIDTVLNYKQLLAGYVVVSTSSSLNNKNNQLLTDHSPYDNKHYAQIPITGGRIKFISSENKSNSMAGQVLYVYSKEEKQFPQYVRYESK